MSIINKAEATCTHCGQRMPVTICHSINVSENPELKEKVKDGSLFLQECPHCGKVNLAKYETLYHDPVKKLMVWLLLVDEVSDPQMEAVSRHAAAMGNYTLRIVSDMGSLMEKVLICDAGLDDMVIELCKYVVKMEMASKAGENAGQLISAAFRFYRMNGEGDGRTLTFMYPSGGQMLGVDIGINVYSDCVGILQRNPQIKPASGFVKIDSEWINSIIR